MPLLSYNYSTFGLDISDLSLKLLQIKKYHDGFVINAWSHRNIKKGIIEKGHIKEKETLMRIIKDMLNNTEGDLTTRYVTACLPETKSFIKLIQVPGDIVAEKKEQREKNEAVYKLLPQHFPIPLEDAHIDWQIIPSATHGDTVDLIVGAVPKIIIDEYSSVIRESGLIPVALEIEAQSIVRALYTDAQNPNPRQPLTNKIAILLNNVKKKIKKTKIEGAANKNKVIKSAKIKTKERKPEQTHLIIDLGATRSSLILWADSSIKFTTSNEFSGAMLTELIGQKMRLSINDAEKTKKICGLDKKKCKGEIRAILEKPMHNLSKSIIETSEFYTSHFSHASPVSQITLCGGGANLPMLSERLSEITGIPVNVKNPFSRIKNINAKKAKKIPENQKLSFTTAAGLALRGIV